MDDKRSTVFGENVFKEPMKEYVSIHFEKSFTIVPGRGANKAVIRALISSIEKVSTKFVLQPPKRFNTFHDIRHGDPFAKVVKQSITE